MPDELIVVDGATFFLSDPNGDTGGEGGAGYFFHDVRHLSRWQLLLDGSPLRTLTSRNVDHYSAVVVAAAHDDDSPQVVVRRDRFISDGLHEDLLVTSYAPERRRVELELRFAADFADVLEAQERRPGDGERIRVERRARHVALRYRRGGFVRDTRIELSRAATISDGSVRFELELDPHEEWHVCVDVAPHAHGRRWPPLLRCGSFRRQEPGIPPAPREWLAQAPALRGGSDELRHTYTRSLVDLAALRLRPREDVPFPVPAGGVPWFMAFFGRDSLVTAYQALPFAPVIARVTLEALALLQATEVDHFRDAEPGKIMHELRVGKLVELGELPHGPYYGTHDATLLFLIVLDEYERWTGDRELVRRLEGPARAALAWMEGPADLDGDGYLEYRSRSPKGLRNQCWRDSDDGVRYADGRIAEPPLATCELQGYAYDARLRTARLARLVWRDRRLAERLEREATELKERFNRDFWLGRRRHYALALDADKQPVDALTSNIGHLLWSGIVDERRAQQTARRLVSRELASGWGIRTLSTRNGGYNPLGYHAGTVWPHDTAFCAEGLRRYGFRREATQVAGALLHAAARFDHQLPELFAGYERDVTDVPISYPEALRPQAWAAGAPLLALRTLLGLDVEGGRVRADPVLPDGMAPIELTNLRVRGRAARVG